jgi:hypothetical protein
MQGISVKLIFINSSRPEVVARLVLLARIVMDKAIAQLAR